MKPLEASELVKVLLLVGLCAWPTVAAGHLPAMFGKEFVRIEDHPADESSAAPYVDIPAPDPVNPDPLDTQIKEWESSAGPYGDGLAEPLTTLGFYYRQRGDYKEAIEAYRRALFVVRVNDGLTSPRQIPILRELQAIYRSAGDFRSLDDTYEKYFRLHRMGAPPYTLEGIDASLEYLRWQRQAYTSGQDGKARSRLLQAFHTNKRMLASMAGAPDIPFEWYLQLVVSQIQNLYLLLGDEPIQEQFDGLLSGRNHGGQKSHEEFVRNSIEYIQQRGVALGRDLLRDVIARGQSLPTRDLAGLHLELGDWFQWNEDVRLANREYAQVVNLLRSAGEVQLLDQWLGQPMELPDETDLWQQVGHDSMPQPVEVIFRYDVSARGEVRNIEVTVPEGADPDQAWRIRRMLRETHFRPRFSQGHAEAATHLTRRYRLVSCRACFTAGSGF